MAEENSSDEENDPENAEMPRLKLQPQDLQQLMCPLLETAEREDTGEKHHHGCSSSKRTAQDNSAS